MALRYGYITAKKKPSARERILSLLKENIGVPVHIDRISEAAKVYEWARVIRTLRQEGWKIEINKKEETYTLLSAEKGEGNTRKQISAKIRYELLRESGNKCQVCGARAAHGAELHIDHKKPVDKGGTNEKSNLWVLCSECNLGKKNLFDDSDNQVEDAPKKTPKQPGAEKRLSAYFENKPNQFIETETLAAVAQTREWTRSIRYIRSKQNKDIRYEKRNGKDGYIYRKN